MSASRRLIWAAMSEKMRILVLNPNTSSGMTSKIAEAARRAASAGTEIIARHSTQGPESIEGYYDEAMSLGGLLSVIRAEPDFVRWFWPASTTPVWMLHAV